MSTFTMLASACGLPGPIAQNWRVLRSYTAAAITPLRPARYDVIAGVNGSGRDERPVEWGAGDTAGDVGDTAADDAGDAAADGAAAGGRLAWAASALAGPSA
jgi:hypothetical protein